jgi:hypothetical protein
MKCRIQNDLILPANLLEDRVLKFIRTPEYREDVRITRIDIDRETRRVTASYTFTFNNTQKTGKGIMFAVDIEDLILNT